MSYLLLIPAYLAYIFLSYQTIQIVYIARKKIIIILQYFKTVSRNRGAPPSLK